MIGVDMGRREENTAHCADGAEVRLQYAALCWREGEAGVEILLITSRDTGRWVIPKGWPMAGLSPEQAAAREAWEEAGVEGAVSPVSLGRFGYLKEMTATAAVPCAVAVYGLRVETLANKFPEKAERKRRWFRPDEAATLVREPDLAALIQGFTPPTQGRQPPISAKSAQRRG
jgi:8-oxo-dGTP pyrophosphatase MutT (NUDIX family)